MFGSLLRLAQRARLDHVAAEHVERHRHAAEFVLSLAAGNRDIGIATREAVHHGGDRRQRTRHAAAEQERQQGGAGQNGERAENETALRTRCRGLVFGGVLDQFDHRDRLSRIVLDLPEIERGRMAVERGVATQSCAVKYAFKFVLAWRPSCRRRVDAMLAETLAVEPIHRQIDAEALLGACRRTGLPKETPMSTTPMLCRRA